MGREALCGDRALAQAAVGIGLGALLSGPVGLLATLIAPQPSWTDAATFITHFRAWHQIPFWLGFVFIGAWIALSARLAAIVPDAWRAQALAALAVTAIYAAMVTLNYTLQVAYVPLAVATRDPNVAY